MALGTGYMEVKVKTTYIGGAHLDSLGHVGIAIHA